MNRNYRNLVIFRKKLLKFLQGVLGTVSFKFYNPLFYFSGFHNFILTETNHFRLFSTAVFACIWPITQKNNILALAPVVMMVVTQCNVLHNVLYCGNGELCMDQIDLIDFPIDSPFHIHGSYTFSMLLIHL